MISVLSSFIAGDCQLEEADLLVKNPGRALISPGAERERLRLLGEPSIQLPDLVAVLTLLSAAPGPFPYRLSFVFVDPDGQVTGSLSTLEFTWPEARSIERVSLRIVGKIDFFEHGGIYRVRFLLDGVPLCEIPLPILWDDQLKQGAYSF